MIIRENYDEAHINELQVSKKTGRDLIERTLFAFGLLEALARVGLKFIFKGGTSLLLLLPYPRRLSTDIDIVVDPETDVEEYIRKASQIFPFKDMEEQIRKGENNIVKRHFKFTYDSPVMQGPLYILLDVLYEENHYRQVVEKEIKNDLLLTEGDNLKVVIPTIDCILGDKMTAFAPHTTGIPIFGKKDMEVIKQFFDVSTLIENYENFDDILDTYYSVSKTEIGYRGGKFTSEQALEDTIRSAVCIGTRGKYAEEDFPAFRKGTHDIVNHIFNAGFSMEVAANMAPRVIYMAACLLAKKQAVIPADLESLRKENLVQQDLKLMKAFRKVRSDGYPYLVLADRLLTEYRG